MKVCIVPYFVSIIAQKLSMSKATRIQKISSPGVGSSFSQRISHLAKITDILSKVNIPQEVLKGSREPDLLIIASISQNVPHLRSEWLISGSGVPFIETSEDEVKIHSDYSDINARFKRLRIKNRLTQEEIGNVLGKSRTTISSIELSRQTISFADLRLIRRKFNVSYDHMIDGGEIFSPTDVKELQEKIDDLKEQLDIYKDIIKFQKAEIARLKV